VKAKLFIRRFIDQVKAQNWTAISLELIVVVFGIILAFQVDHWNESRKLREVVLDNLSGLAQDFATNRNLLLDVRDRHLRSTHAIEYILAFGSDPKDTLNHDDFYEKMRHVSASRKFTVVSRTYDSLISAGLVEIIPSEELKATIAKFYNLVERIANAQEDVQAIQTLVLDPYISKNLDHAALMNFTHPEADQLKPYRALDQFQEIIGTDEFKGVLVTKWHVSHDLAALYSEALLQIDTIDFLIRQLVDQDMVLDH
jgi:hypothetical protein